jgi:hypothetical protein
MTTKCALPITGDMVMNESDIILAIMGKRDINQNITQITFNTAIVSVMKEMNTKL